jgi:hypothetical protein
MVEFSTKKMKVPKEAMARRLAFRLVDSGLILVNVYIFNKVKYDGPSNISFILFSRNTSNEKNWDISISNGCIYHYGILTNLIA